MVTDLVEIRRLGSAKKDENLGFRRYLSAHHHRVEELQSLAAQIQPRIDCTTCANCCRCGAAVLLKLMADPTTPASVRVRAAESVLNQATKALEIEDLEARVAQFERDAQGRHMGDAGVECSMRHTLVSRLERLESQRVDADFKTLPVDSVDERHVVIVEQERTCSDLEACQCEERPRPVPPDSEDPGCHIYFTEDDPNL